MIEDISSVLFTIRIRIRISFIGQVTHTRNLTLFCFLCAQCTDVNMNVNLNITNIRLEEQKNGVKKIKYVNK